MKPCGVVKVAQIVECYAGSSNRRFRSEQLDPSQCGLNRFLIELFGFFDTCPRRRRDAGGIVIGRPHGGLEGVKKVRMHL